MPNARARTASFGSRASAMTEWRVAGKGSWVTPIFVREAAEEGAVRGTMIHAGRAGRQRKLRPRCALSFPHRFARMQKQLPAWARSIVAAAAIGLAVAAGVALAG